MRPRSSEMKAADEDQSITPCRGRPTSKLKVLGRSHAMREEQSPPREPAAEENAAQLHSPPTVILSPSPVDEEVSTHESPSKSSSARTSHCEGNDGYERLHPLEIDSSPKRTATESEKCSAAVSFQNRNFCDCQHQTCIKCLKDRGGNNNNHSNMNHNVLHVGRNRGKLRQQSSSQTSLSFESSSGNSPCLSRDSSADHYTDTTGADLERFIPATINRCAKDRALMLRIEEELLSLIHDQFQSHYKFPPMSSYHRMLVHRCAAYFGMDHNIDQLGKCIIVNKTKNTRLPEVRFKDHIKEMFNDEPPRRSILKRDSNSMEDYFKSTDSGYGMEVRRSKSFEERELEYKKAKRRIFEMQESAEDLRWAGLEWLQPPSQTRQIRKLLKVQSEETEQSMRPCVAKSFSFGGYGGGGVSILTRGDSVSSTRLLSKQDSGTSSMWRLSPSSSGYKSQSQVSESATPSPTSTPQLPDGDDQQLNKSAGNPVMWAVSDLSHVPKGSIIFNPETGKPYRNDDDTIYYYDPEKPAPAGLMFNHVGTQVEELDDALTPQLEKTPMPSPKHQKSLPVKAQRHARTESSFTNSATSPSLPFSPPPAHSSASVGRNYSYVQAVHPCENAGNAPQQQFTEFPSNPAPEGNVPLYTPPYIVYTATPYGVPVPQQFDSRLGLSSMTEISTTYFVPEAAGAAAPPPIGYSSQPAGAFWNQSPVTFYPNAPPPQPPIQPAVQRYAAQEQQGFAPAPFPAVVNYVPAQQAAAQHQGGEMVPVYANQPMHMLYPQGQSNGGVIYQGQPSFAYAHNAAAYQPAGEFRRNPAAM
ncbi:hypothetical protein HUJ04_013213 [Dendroctonus ponderosae]|nr:hypothetical protein HUJ04_013213 [Dendroctonus ponderosae]